jgi:hypothetical protein
VKSGAAPSAIIFQKTESDFAALGRRGALPLGHIMSVIDLRLAQLRSANAAISLRSRSHHRRTVRCIVCIGAQAH